MKAIEISIIIVNYNAKEFIKNCLLSIIKTTKLINHEIIVVDNHSSDNSAELIRKEFPNVKLIQNKNNVGFAKANNRGIEIARGDFILLLNPDTVVFNGTIRKMIDYAQKFPNADIISCRVLNPARIIQWDSCGRFLNPLTFFLKESGLEKLFPNNHFFGRRLMHYWPRDSSRPIDWVSGVCMLINRKIIEDIGMLDVRFFSYMEDMDFCYRARQKNWRVYFLGDVEILHNLSASWKQNSGKHLFTSLDSEKKYLGKYYGYLGILLFKSSYLLGSYLRFFINTIKKDKWKAKDHYRILKWLIKHEI